MFCVRYWMAHVNCPGRGPACPSISRGRFSLSVEGRIKLLVLLLVLLLSVEHVACASGATGLFPLLQKPKKEAKWEVESLELGAGACLPTNSGEGTHSAAAGILGGLSWKKGPWHLALFSGFSSALGQAPENGGGVWLGGQARWRKLWFAGRSQAGMAALTRVTEESQPFYISGYGEMALGKLRGQVTITGDALRDQGWLLSLWHPQGGERWIGRLTQGSDLTSWQIRASGERQLAPGQRIVCDLALETWRALEMRGRRAQLRAGADVWNNATGRLRLYAGMAATVEGSELVSAFSYRQRVAEGAYELEVGRSLRPLPSNDTGTYLRTSTEKEAGKWQLALQLEVRDETAWSPGFCFTVSSEGKPGLHFSFWYYGERAGLAMNYSF